MVELLKTWMFGPRCRWGCGERVHPANTVAHFQIEHAGDLLG